MKSVFPLAVALSAVISAGFCSPVTVVVNSVADCEVEEDPIQEGFSLDTRFENGLFFAKVVAPFVIDDTVEYLITVKEFKREKWVDLDYQTSGGFCDGWEIYAEKAFEKIAEILHLEAPCPIPAGTYEVSNFTLERGDVEVDTTKKAHYLVKMQFLKDDKPLACREVEIDVQ